MMLVWSFCLPTQLPRALIIRSTVDSRLWNFEQPKRRFEGSSTCVVCNQTIVPSLFGGFGSRSIPTMIRTPMEGSSKCVVCHQNIVTSLFGRFGSRTTPKTIRTPMEGSSMNGLFPNNQNDDVMSFNRRLYSKRQKRPCHVIQATFVF